MNEVRQTTRESLLRKEYRKMFTLVDNQIKRLYPANRFNFQEDKNSESPRWEYPAKSPSSDEPSAKRIKIEEEPTTTEEIPTSKLCVICFEKERTHAFLHFGLSKQDVTSHFVACESCANSCRWADNGCPVCRSPCINVIKIIQ
jgi:hypothetical protein